jgi:hypothetical protein
MNKKACYPEEKYRLMVENAVAISWKNKPAILSFIMTSRPANAWRLNSNEPRKCAPWV